MILGIGLAAGCAAETTTRFEGASETEFVCRHCNCIMPKNIEPHAMCPVCECKKTARECRRF